MSTSKVSNHVGPPPYTIPRIADCIAILLLAYSISIFFQTRWGSTGGNLVFFWGINIVLLANAFFSSRIWRIITIGVLVILVAVSQYVAYAVIPAEKAQFENTIAQERQALISERLRMDQEQQKQK